jgi:uncharacterized protein (TIGR00730 family)
MNSVCVFAGSKKGRSPSYAEAARQLGIALAEEGITLVYGGGANGLMAETANGALESGGTVIGVMARETMHKETAHPGLTKLLFTTSLSVRKAEMAALSDAFIALPGGFGTLEEFSEVYTGRIMGLHTKPVGLLNTESYFQALIDFLGQVVENEFMKEKYRELLVVEQEPRVLIQKLKSLCL